MTTELDQLATIAAEADAATAPPPVVDPNAPPPPPPVDYLREAGQAIETFTALVVGYAPATSEVWTDAAKARVTAALVPVMEKYAMTFGNLPPELMLLIVAGPPLYQSSKLIAAQMKSEKVAKALEKPEAKPAAAKPDAPELLVHPQVALYQ